MGDKEEERGGEKWKEDEAQGERRKVKVPGPVASPAPGGGLSPSPASARLI